MANASRPKRTSRACEYCRKSRRRCEPPYPCRQCQSAGIDCKVRDRARPRRQRRLQVLPCTTESSTRQDRGSSAITADKGGIKSSDASPSTSNDSVYSRDLEERNLSSDTFEMFRDLVQDTLKARYSYKSSCILTEPTLLVDGRIDTRWSPSVLEHDQVADSSTCPANTWECLLHFQESIGWEGTGLVDSVRLHDIASMIFKSCVSLTPAMIVRSANVLKLSIDSVALAFAALSIGASALHHIIDSKNFFTISDELVKHFTGGSSLQLCQTLFLQHISALRIGTLNFAHGIIAQAIHHAHILKLQHNTGGMPGLQFYLLLYMADQYCSLTHNTELLIQSSDSMGAYFKPLRDACPQLGPMIALVIGNGCVLEHLHKETEQSNQELQRLESILSHQYSQPLKDEPDAKDHLVCFKSLYEPVARIHMFCCRLKLMAPRLQARNTSLSSLCISIHAAEGILDTYLELYCPGLESILLSGQTSDNHAKKLFCRLPATWRQVKRIMMAASVMLFAYLCGELSQKQASRHIEMACLLLEYPRERWGEAMHETVQWLCDICDISGLEINYDARRLLSLSTSQRSGNVALQIQTRGLSDPAWQSLNEITGGPDAFDVWPEAAEVGYNIDAFAYSSNVVGEY